MSVISGLRGVQQKDREPVLLHRKEGAGEETEEKAGKARNSSLPLGVVPGICGQEQKRRLIEVSFRLCYSEQPGGACAVSLCLTQDINHLLGCQELSWLTGRAAGAVLVPANLDTGA